MNEKEAQLKNICFKINNSEKNYLLTIIDLKTNKKIINYKPAEEILEEYGSGEVLFEKIAQMGVAKILIRQNKKAGTGRPSAGEPLEISFINEQDKQEEQENINEVAIITKEKNTPMEGFFGLGSPHQIMELYVEKNEASRLRTENAELKADNKVLKEANEGYKEKLLEDKYNFEKDQHKSKNTKEIVGALSGIVMPFISSLSVNQGLNGTQQQIDYGSEVKNELVKNLPLIDDNVIQMLFSIYTATQTNEDFNKEFLLLKEKYQI